MEEENKTQEVKKDVKDEDNPEETEESEEVQ